MALDVQINTNGNTLTLVVTPGSTYGPMNVSVSVMKRPNGEEQNGDRQGSTVLTFTYTLTPGDYDITVECGLEMFISAVTIGSGLSLVARMFSTNPDAFPERPGPSL